MPNVSAVQELPALVDRHGLTAEQSERGIEPARPTLPQVSHCDELTITVETPPDTEVNDILWGREAALDAGLDLVAWSATTRERPV